MRTTPLPFEQICAEAYLVGSEVDTGYYTLGRFMREVPDLARLPKAPDGFTRSNANPEFRDNAEGQTIDRTAYMHWLHRCRSDPTLQETVRVAASGLARYAQFRPVVDQLLAALNEDSESITTLGEGKDAQVYPITVNGQEFAAHVFREDGPDSGLGTVLQVPQMYGGVEQYRTVLAALKGITLAHGHGIEGLVQLAAFSPADGICISPLIPSKIVAHLTVDDVRHITPSHITAHIRTLKAMQKRGMTTDPNVGNTVWHPGLGFPILDPGIGYMSNEDASAALEVLVRGIVATPESHGTDELVEDPEKAAAAKSILRTLRQRARRDFGTWLPLTTDELMQSERERERL